MENRGADVLVAGLKAAGVTRVFSLSGNHIMAVYDALLGSGIGIVHTRHEAAAVHMADAHARLTGEPAVALVTGGQGHANAVPAFCTAQGGESPVVLLSGHAPLTELGLGAFQELRQAEMAEPVAKASWTAASAEGLAGDLARAFRLARSGRPGPVHLSLPTDALEGRAAAAPIPGAAEFAEAPMPLAAQAAAMVAEAVAGAARPLIIAPPSFCSPAGAGLMAALEAASGLPVVPMNSPRGLADPALGAFPQVLAEADLILLLGKPLDFTLRMGRAPAIAPACRFLVIEPEAPLLARAQRLLGERLILAAIADPRAAAAALARHLRRVPAQEAWAERVREHIAFRPAAWARLAGMPEGAIHPATLAFAITEALAGQDAVFVCDGGEVGQWGASLVHAPMRVTNGVAGAIGVGIPFAIGAKAARPDAPVVALMGDGSFGFHMAELDTAARHGLPIVAVVGNDARWNAEHQIQLRDYGAARAHGCDLAPGTRYDLVAAALGGHGEHVQQAADLGPALARALASGRSAVVNVEIEGHPAPSVRRG